MSHLYYTIAAGLIFAIGVVGIALRRNHMQTLACAGLIFGAAALEISASRGINCSDGEACFLTIVVAAILCAALATGTAAAAFAARKNPDTDEGL